MATVQKSHLSIIQVTWRITNWNKDIQTVQSSLTGYAFMGFIGRVCNKTTSYNE